MGRCLHLEQHCCMFKRNLNDIYNIFKLPFHSDFYTFGKSKRNFAKSSLKYIKSFLYLLSNQNSASRAKLTRQHIVIIYIMSLRNIPAVVCVKTTLTVWNASKLVANHDLHTIATRIEKSLMWSSTLDMMDWSCGKQKWFAVAQKRHVLQGLVPNFICTQHSNQFHWGHVTKRPRGLTTQQSLMFE